MNYRCTSCGMVFSGQPPYCPQCGKQLNWNAINTPLRAQNQGVSETAGPAFSQQKTSSKILSGCSRVPAGCIGWIVILVIGLAFAGISSLTSGGNSNRSVSSSSTVNNSQQNNRAEASFNEPEVPAPANGVVTFYANSADAQAAIANENYGPLSVKVPSGSNYYYVLLKRLDDTKYMSFFVYPGTTVEVEVPFGDYTLYYAVGETWYGAQHFFGPDTVYAQADDVFSFYLEGNQLIGHSVELILQANGNLDTSSANASDFK